MSGNIGFGNIKYFFKAVLKIKNWYDYFLDLFNIKTGSYLTFNFRNGLKYVCRTGTTDRGIVTSTALADEYKISDKGFKYINVIDLGGQIGTFSVTVSPYAKKIFVYEPMPENFSMLKKNILINRLQKKIFPFRLAVSNKKGKSRLHISGDNTGGHSIYGEGKSVIVKTTTLEDIFISNNISICDVLKIDIEGSEYDVLYSLPNNYYKRIKYICMEYHNIDSLKKNFKSLYKFLKKQGFSISYDNAILWASRKK